MGEGGMESYNGNATYFAAISFWNSLLISHQSTTSTRNGRSDSRNAFCSSAIVFSGTILSVRTARSRSECGFEVPLPRDPNTSTTDIPSRARHPASSLFPASHPHRATSDRHPARLQTRRRPAGGWSISWSWRCSYRLGSSIATAKKWAITTACPSGSGSCRPAERLCWGRSARGSRAIPE